MPRVSELLVLALRLTCAIEQVADDLLFNVGYRRRSFSQKGQDRWIIDEVLKEKRRGFFVELGAGNGRTHSNTYLLERDYDWHGVLIEANPKYASDICTNRTCTFVPCCVDGHLEECNFFCFGYLGGIIADDTDYNSQNRSSLIDRHPDKILRVRPQLLEDVLDSVAAPHHINYLSLDVEGAEHRILSSFPFHRFKFDALTIERPTSVVHELLSAAGYVLHKIYRYDGFYVSRAVAAQLRISERRFGGLQSKGF